MASIVVPGLDLAPSVPSRIVTVDVIDMTEGLPAAGAKIDFILPQDLHARADGKVLKAGTTTLTLDANGHGEIRVPAYTTDTKPEDWVILVKKSWAPHAYPIRVAPGDTKVSLASLETPMEVDPNMAKYLLTDAAATIQEGAQWSVNVETLGNIANFKFTAPPGGTAYFRGNLTASSNIYALETGVYSVPNATVAAALPLPEKVIGTITNTLLVGNGANQRMVFSAGNSDRMWVCNRNALGWGPWMPVSGVSRLTTATAQTWEDLPDGEYWTDLAAVQAAFGLPAKIGYLRKTKHPTTAYGYAEMVEWTNSGLPIRWVTQSQTGGWRSWLQEQGSSGGGGGPIGETVSHLWMEDIPSAGRNLLQIEHRSDGSGREGGQTYGVDLHNYPNARQAIVIHQYSRAREAFRLDNTDSEAGVYINNTQNPNMNPDRQGVGAFLKLHPYNMDDFLRFAYLMDDLTWKNDSTGKTWAFQETDPTKPIMQFKNAAGVVVAEITQTGEFRKL